MVWRNIILTESCQLKLKHNQLEYTSDQNQLTIPLEDIAVIVVETPQAIISSALLSAFTEYGISLFTCDKSHIPNGLFLPFMQHSRNAKVIQRQLAWTEPFKKRCWQLLVRQKIHNQYLSLFYKKQIHNAQLKRLSETVNSGDTNNHEAQAARIYFGNLFPNLKRQDSTLRDSALNYGYSIIRGAIARSVVAYGFMPSIGLKHCSELNQFNLVDDLIEPFRPLVDMKVSEMFNDEEASDYRKLSKEERAELVALLNVDIDVNGEKTSILRASDAIAASLSSASESLEPKKLILPIILAQIKEHQYE